MTLSNLHTHTRFSDGSDAPEKYCEEAVRQGFQTLGFTDHAPVPFENTFAIGEGELNRYVESILRIKRENTNPEILLGLEIDYIPGIAEPFDAYRKEYPFDYLIGSVHLVRNGSGNDLWFIDGHEIAIYDQGLKEVFGGDIRLAVTSYYRQVQSMVAKYKPDIVGHVDKIKMYNRGRYFSEEDQWYQGLVDETLEIIKHAGSVVELNTRGVYKKRSQDFFPGPAILRKMQKLGIPVTIVSDAHKPEELSLGFTEAAIALKRAGFNSMFTLKKSGWKEVPV